MATIVNTVVLERGLRALFVEAFNNAEDAAELAPYILETTSDGADEKYGWLGQSPSMVEWIDERRLKALNDFDYTLKNKDYEATLSVDRNELADDRMGAIKIRINDLALKAKSTHPRRLFFDALVAGTTALAYDGLPLFSASHQEGASGVQSNIVTGTGVTVAQITADLDTAILRMRSFKDDVGEPMSEVDPAIGIISPLALQKTFRNINTLDYIGDGVQNTYKGQIKSIVSSSRLVDANDWYVVDISPGIKPFIHQLRQPVTFAALEAGSDQGFMRKKYAYGVDSREVFGYGLWQKIIKVTNT